MAFLRLFTGRNVGLRREGALGREKERREKDEETCLVEPSAVVVMTETTRVGGWPGSGVLVSGCQKALQTMEYQDQTKELKTGK